MITEPTPTAISESTEASTSLPAPPASTSSKPSKTARGRPTDDPDTRWSKTLSYILRHGAEKESLVLREDGFVKVGDLVRSPLSLCSSRKGADARITGITDEETEAEGM